MQHCYMARVAVVMAALYCVLGLVPSGAQAQSIVPPRDMLALSGTVNPGATTTLVTVGSNRPRRLSSRPGKC